MPPALTDYTWAFGESGYVLNVDNFSTLPFFDVTSITGLDSAPPRTNTSEHQGTDGTYVDSQYMSMRTIIITGNLYTAASDPDTVCSLLKQQYGVGQGIQPFYFKHPNQPLKFINAQATGATYSVDVNRRIGITPMMLTLLASDPYIYDYPAESVIVPIGTLGGFSVLNLNSDFESNVTNWTAANGATIAQSAAQAYSGLNSMLMTPNGVTAVPKSSAELDAIVPGNTYVALAKVFCSAAYATGVQVVINWYTSGSVYISTTSGPPVALSATTWTPLQIAGTAPATAAFGQIVVQAIGTPSAATLFYWDLCQLGLYSGMGFNMGFNMGFGTMVVTATGFVYNNGTHTAYPIIKLNGPLNNPVVADTVLGISMPFSINLASTDQLVIDCNARSVVLNKTSSARTALQGRKWFSIPSQTGDSFFLSAGGGTGNMEVDLYNTYY